MGGAASCGSWACTPGGWDSPNARPSTEWFYVLSGRGAVTDPDGTPHPFGPGDVVVLPKGAPKLGAPKASAGPAHLRRAPPPPSVGKVLRDKATGQLLAPAQQERAQLQAAMQASAREYEAEIATSESIRV